MYVRYNRLFCYFEWLGHLGQWELNTAFGFFLMPQTPGCTWQLTIFLNRHFLLDETFNTCMERTSHYKCMVSCCKF